MGAASSIKQTSSAPTAINGNAASVKDIFQEAFTRDIIASSILTKKDILERLTATETKTVTIGTRKCRYAALMLRGLYPVSMHAFLPS